MSEMVERVARAIYNAATRHSESPEVRKRRSWERATDLHDKYRAVALAAIEAVRETEAIASAMIQVLLDLPDNRRKEVLEAIRYNGIFCPECGFGSRETPNPNCQCGNDE